MRLLLMLLLMPRIMMLLLLSLSPRLARSQQRAVEDLVQRHWSHGGAHVEEAAEAAAQDGRGRTCAHR